MSYLNLLIRANVMEISKRCLFQEELLQQRSVVYSNTVHAMAELLKGMAMYKIGFKEQKRAVNLFILVENFVIAKISFTDAMIFYLICGMKSA